MDLELSSDQQFFVETTRKFLESETPLTAVRDLLDDPAGYDPAWWRRGAELGWTSMLVPEEYGGGSLSGAALLDLILVAEEIGRMVSPGPLLPTSILAAAVAESGTPEQRQSVLPGIVSGDVIGAWCFAEPGGGWQPGDVSLGAEPRGEGFVLSGTKTKVEAAGQADQLLVTARTPGGLTQFLVPAGTAGVRVAPMKSLDFVKRFAEVHFDGVEVPASAVVGAVGGAGADVERQLQLALALQCAETAGATARVFEFTTEYAFDRFSFGRPLASYQALKHRFADMKLWLEACHATTSAASAAVQARADDAPKLVSVAKAYVGDHATEIMQDCVQMFGGIGVTWDHDIHLYLRRATVNRALYGTPTEHRDRIATLVGI
ncbi:MAG TPA: acyl-CoA dehydrogenase family protein [Acidimicrobiales bacterium]|nr:acyl-CoA dehydrogenase family protein [Acidimicrobiales bacterium]